MMILMWNPTTDSISSYEYFLKINKLVFFLITTLNN
jgi:hypothetical protein